MLYKADSSGVGQITNEAGEWNVTRAQTLLIGLTPYTNYSTQVAAVNEQEDVGLYSDPIITQTLEDSKYINAVFFNPLIPVPGPVNLTAVPSFFNITLTWEKPAEPNGVIIAYEVSYMPTNSSQDVTKLNTTDLATSFTTLSDMEVETEFTFFVRAYTQVGPGNTTFVTISTLNSPRNNIYACSVQYMY